MRSRKWAKQAAAMKCCELLYSAGQLDENLLPVQYNWEKDIAFIMENVDKEDVPDGSCVPGTKRRRQYYFKVVSHMWWLQLIEVVI